MFLATILGLFLFLGLLVIALVKQNKPTFIAAVASFILLLVLAIVGIRNGISKLSKHVKKDSMILRKKWMKCPNGKKIAIAEWKHIN